MIDRAAVHLTVIAYPSNLQSVFEAVVLRARPDARHRFARCQRPGQLRQVLANVGAPVGLLDVYGHGAPGRLQLGDGMLLDGSTRAIRTLRAVIDPYLAAAAPVRLLACNTAAGAIGREALHRLASVLGRPVLGTTRAPVPSDFGPSGLRATAARSLLTCARPQRAARSTQRMVVAKEICCAG